MKSENYYKQQHFSTENLSLFCLRESLIGQCWSLAQKSHFANAVFISNLAHFLLHKKSCYSEMNWWGKRRVTGYLMSSIRAIFNFLYSPFSPLADFRADTTISELRDERTRLGCAVALPLKAQKQSSSQWRQRPVSGEASVLPMWFEDTLLTWQANTVFGKMHTSRNSHATLSRWIITDVCPRNCGPRHRRSL